MILNREWKMLPSLKAPRWFHACSQTTRFGQNNLVAIGGTDDISNSIINTIEYYNLVLRPSAWTTDSEFFNKLADNLIVGCISISINTLNINYVTICNSSYKLYNDLLLQGSMSTSFWYNMYFSLER
jgi:hypothetical protein